MRVPRILAWPLAKVLLGLAILLAESVYGQSHKLAHFHWQAVPGAVFYLARATQGEGNYLILTRGTEIVFTEDDTSLTVTAHGKNGETLAQVAVRKDFLESADELESGAMSAPPPEPYEIVLSPEEKAANEEVKKLDSEAREAFDKPINRQLVAGLGLGVERYKGSADSNSLDATVPVAPIALSFFGVPAPGTWTWGLSLVAHTFVVNAQQSNPNVADAGSIKFFGQHNLIAGWGRFRVPNFDAGTLDADLGLATIEHPSLTAADSTTGLSGVTNVRSWGPILGINYAYDIADSLVFSTRWQFVPLLLQGAKSGTYDALQLGLGSKFADAFTLIFAAEARQETQVYKQTCTDSSISAGCKTTSRAANQATILWLTGSLEL